ncbi:MAG: hypothetical protein ACJ71E_07795 [Nitrososphaeraceae archaeon]
MTYLIYLTGIRAAIDNPYCRLYFGNDDIFFSVYLSDNSFQGEVHLNTIKKLGSNCDD